VRAIDDTGHGIEVQSIGRSLEIIKDLGDAETVNARHHIDRFVGSHGLGHVRLTTESIVDVAYGHPFWAEPFPDISIVHNGQLTNYFRFRRLLTQEGYRFHTTNDSELIAVYLADRMLHGETLWDALKTSVDELDGCFAYLFATEDEMGSAKDPLAIKSLVATNVEGVMAIATEEQALRQVRELRPDVVVMDIRMPGINGLEATRRITGDPVLTATRVLVLTTFELDEYVFEAIRAGASGFLVKDTEPEELLRAVRAVVGGDALLSPGVTRRLIAEFAARSKEPAAAAVLDRLTEREREVMALVGIGLSNEEIARRLVVSPLTAKTHVSRAMVKLGARDRAQLVVMAYESGLVRPGWLG